MKNHLKPKNECQTPHWQRIFVCLTYDILVEPPTAKVQVKSTKTRWLQVLEVSKLTGIHLWYMYIHCNVIYTHWLFFLVIDVDRYIIWIYKNAWCHKIITIITINPMQILHHYHHPMDSWKKKTEKKTKKFGRVFGKPRLCGWSSGLLLVDCEDGALERHFQSFPVPKVGDGRYPAKTHLGWC